MKSLKKMCIGQRLIESGLTASRLLSIILMIGMVSEVQSAAGTGRRTKSQDFVFIAPQSQNIGMGKSPVTVRAPQAGGAAAQNTHYEYDGSLNSNPYLISTPTSDPQGTFDSLFSEYERKGNKFSTKVVLEVEALAGEITAELEHAKSLTYLAPKDGEELKDLAKKCDDVLTGIKFHLESGKNDKSFTHKRTPENIQDIHQDLDRLRVLKEDISKVVFHFRRNDETKAEQEERLRQGQEKVFEIEKQKRMQAMKVKIEKIRKKFTDETTAALIQSNYSDMRTHEQNAFELLRSSSLSPETRRIISERIQTLRTRAAEQKAVAEAAARQGNKRNEYINWRYTPSEPAAPVVAMEPIHGTRFEY
jgi:hypothetical protein